MLCIETSMGKKEKQADRFVDNVNGCDLSVVLLALVGSGISLDISLISHSFPYLSYQDTRA